MLDIFLKRVARIFHIRFNNSNQFSIEYKERINYSVNVAAAKEGKGEEDAKELEEMAEDGVRQDLWITHSTLLCRIGVKTEILTCISPWSL